MILLEADFNLKKKNCDENDESGGEGSSDKYKPIQHTDMTQKH